jgi:sterol desaturase/sphingolipid hydroxylase (fatty acid hydroxylase superfamily)
MRTSSSAAQDAQQAAVAMKKAQPATAVEAVVSVTDHVSESSASDSDRDDDKPIVRTTSALLPWTGALVWPLMLAVPLLLSSPYSPTSYLQLFSAAWYEYNPESTERPKPLGLVLGILAVAVGQVWVWAFFYLFKFGFLGTRPRSIQVKGARDYSFGEGLVTHISQPEGFVLLVGYLAVTWLLHLMPHSYYSFQGSIQWKKLGLCLVLQDGIQYLMHILEHVASPAFYQRSHKPHHRFTNPRLFDAFNGSLADTFCMITVPLFLTANIVRTCNVWTYMAFGSTYASWLTLIHSEYVFPWDAVFRRAGLGTPADHHVHHKFFKFNYGHLFMWFDQIGGTYRDPKTFSPKVFREGV